MKSTGFSFRYKESARNDVLYLSGKILFFVFFLSSVGHSDTANLKSYEKENRYYVIQYPKKWTAKPNRSGTQVYLSSPVLKEGYNRSIHVTRFKTPIFLDEIELDFQKEKLEQRFKRTLGTLAEFEITMAKVIDLSPKRKALLYYATFLIQGKKFMQAHMLTGTRDFHLLVTYTDAEEAFSNPDEEPFRTMWSVITGIVVNGSPPRARFSFVRFIALGITMFVVFSLLIFAIRRHHQTRYMAFAEDDFEEVDSSSPNAQDKGASYSKKEEPVEDEIEQWKVSS